MKILVYGYGNPGRQDDGLGPALAEKIESWLPDSGIDYVEVDSNYQLNIEDADAISDKDIVFFADASIEEIDKFIITEVKPDDAQIEFTMHAVSTDFVLDLCQKIYGKYPKTFLIHMKGYEWDFSEGLTEKGNESLEEAFEFIKPLLAEPSKIDELKLD